MDRDTLVSEVVQRTGIDSPAVAETAVGATLRVLGERIGSGASKAIADHLPEEFAGYLERDQRDAATFPVEEFYRRVNRYEHEDGLDIDEEVTRNHVRAVLAAIATDPAIRHELESTREQLPTSYDTLFSGGESST